MNPSENKNNQLNELPESEMRLRHEEALSHSCLMTRINEAAACIERPPDLCIALVNVLLEFTSAENCSIMLHQPDSGSLNMVVAKGRNDRGSFYGFENHPTVAFAYGEGAAGWAAENAELLSINDCERDSRFVMRESAVKSVRSVICAPIVADNIVIGVINCSHPKKEKFSDADEQVVSLVAGQASIMLQKALLIDTLKKETSTLTKQTEEGGKRVQELETKLSNLHDQLYKSERFATLGEMLAGIAHELNNRLAPILIYSQMLRERSEEDKDGKKLRIIEESAMGAKAILETLLDYSRPGAKERCPVNLNQTIQNTLTLAEYKLKNNDIEIMLDLCAHLPPIVVNEKQIAQVFLNLVNNALSAMEGKGGQLRISSIYDSKNIRFSFSDTGPGVPDEIADRIFDPFFTTKQSGKGTGLGLSMSRHYLEEHKGTIRLDRSSSGGAGGATFIVEIARTDIPEKVPAKLLYSGEQSKPSARILVVEDDTIICDVIRDILGSRYDLEFATDGHEATNKIENDLFDLLVVDYHMPGLDGKQLYQWIMQHRPSLKQRIVFSTGDIFHDDIRSFIEGTGCYSLTKPFSTTDLRETISCLLNA